MIGSERLAGETTVEDVHVLFPHYSCFGIPFVTGRSTLRSALLQIALAPFDDLFGTLAHGIY
ncbi:hypothetical protein LR032_01235 [Candidatus Bipolaricaulota bacterium]|nr:hypothetical protein [Candidatus Bipolaricaulota bacterium]